MAISQSAWMVPPVSRGRLSHNRWGWGREQCRRVTAFTSYFAWLSLTYHVVEVAR